MSTTPPLTPTSPGPGPLQRFLNVVTPRSSSAPVCPSPLRSSMSGGSPRLTPRADTPNSPSGRRVSIRMEELPGPIKTQQIEALFAFFTGVFQRRETDQLKGHLNAVIDKQPTPAVRIFENIFQVYEEPFQACYKNLALARAEYEHKMRFYLEKPTLENLADQNRAANEYFTQKKKFLKFYDQFKPKVEKELMIKIEGDCVIPDRWECDETRFKLPKQVIKTAFVTHLCRVHKIPKKGQKKQLFAKTNAAMRATLGNNYLADFNEHINKRIRMHYDQTFPAGVQPSKVWQSDEKLKALYVKHMLNRCAVRIDSMRYNAHTIALSLKKNEVTKPKRAIKSEQSPEVTTKSGSRIARLRIPTAEIPEEASLTPRENELIPAVTLEHPQYASDKLLDTAPFVEDAKKIKDEVVTPIREYGKFYQKAAYECQQIVFELLANLESQKKEDEPLILHLRFINFFLEEQLAFMTRQLPFLSEDNHLK